MKDHPSLFDEPERRPALKPARVFVRRDAEPTSEAAAIRALRRADSDKRRVAYAVLATGEVGRTCDELEVELGLAHQSASARVRDLRGEGVLEDSGRRRPTRTGTPAIVLVVTAEARRLLGAEVDA